MTDDTTAQNQKFFEEVYKPEAKEIYQKLGKFIDDEIDPDTPEKRLSVLAAVLTILTTIFVQAEEEHQYGIDFIQDVLKKMILVYSGRAEVGLVVVDGSTDRIEHVGSLYVDEEAVRSLEGESSRRRSKSHD